MSEIEHNNIARSKTVSRNEWRFIIAWAVFLILVCLVTGIITAHGLHHSKMDAVARHQKWITPAQLDVKAGDNQTQSQPIKVQAGIYLDRVPTVSIKEGFWTADFYLWLKWKGNTINPGDKIQIVDGSIESKEIEREIVQGDEHYVLYRIFARMSKFFDISRFPVDDHMLTIDIENPYLRNEMIFVPDVDGSKVSSRVNMPGYTESGMIVLETPHLYKSNFSDPRIRTDFRAVNSQFRTGILIYREGLGFYFKLFIALFVAMATAFISLFIPPRDVEPRFGLAVGALFAAVANTYITVSLVPEADVTTLADLVNGIGIATIVFILAQSAISLHMYKEMGNKVLSKLFDVVSLYTLVAGYVVLNVSLVLAAMVV